MPALQRRGEDERLERRARLALALRREVERARRGSPCRRPSRGPRRSRCRSRPAPPPGPTPAEAAAAIACLGRLLEVEVERRLDLQPALEGAPRAEAVDELLADPGREVRRLACRPSAATILRAAAPAAIASSYSRARDLALLEHLAQHEVAPRERGARVRDRVVRGRGGDDAGEQRRLGGGQLLGARAAGACRSRVVGIRAEVDARRRLDAVGAVAEVDRVQVLGEDLVLGPLARQVVGERRLAQLLEDRAVALRLERVLDELLRDRRAALARRRRATTSWTERARRCRAGRRPGSRRSAGPRSR